MAKKKEKIILRPNNDTMEYKGKIFKHARNKLKKIDGIEHTEAMIYEEIDMKEYDKKVAFLIKNVKKVVPIERVIEEVIKKDLTTQELNQIHNRLKKREAKITRQDGCLGILFDAGKGKRKYLQIFD